MKLFLQIQTLLMCLITSSLSTAQELNKWVGSTDYEWSTDSNWSKGSAPVSTDSVVIDISGDSVHVDVDFAVKNVTINNGAKIDLCDQNVTITGNWNNVSGEVYQGGGTIVFIGNSVQKIKGDNEFNDLIINNNNVVKIQQGTLVVHGIVNVLSGDLQTNDNLIIKTDSLGNGAIGPIHGTITGDIKLKREININSSDWRCLSSPVNGSTISELDDDMWTAGFPGSTYPGMSFVSLYFYDESYTGTAGWVAPNSINDDIPLGSGMYVYMGSSSFDGVLDFEGPVNNGDVTLPLTYTTSEPGYDGWNLVGNPYACAIDWDDPSITKTNVYDAIYIWNPELGVYSAYVDGIGSNGGTNIISSCQGFWVKTNDDNPEITLTQESKSFDDTPMLRQNSANEFVKIKLSDNLKHCETIIKNNPYATTSFDSNLDALFYGPFSTNGPLVYTAIPSEQNIYTINQFPEQEITLDLYTIVNSSGTYELSFEGLTAFENYKCIRLSDKFTGDVYEIDDSSAISFQLNDTTTISRFSLLLGAPTEIQPIKVSCHGQSDGTIDVAVNSDSLFNVMWMDSFGNEIHSETGNLHVAWLDNLAPGQYVIETEGPVCGASQDTVTITEPLEISADFSFLEDTVIYSNQPIDVYITNQSNNADYYEWDLGMSGLQTSEDALYTVNSPGVHTIELIAFQTNDCFKSQTKDLIVLSTAGLEENTSNPNIFVNNDNQLIIKDASSKDEIILYSIDGKLLYHNTLNSSFTSIDLNVYSHNVMLVSLISNTSRKVKKVIKR